MLKKSLHIFVLFAFLSPLLAQNFASHDFLHALYNNTQDHHHEHSVEFTNLKTEVHPIVASVSHLNEHAHVDLHKNINLLKATKQLKKIASHNTHRQNTVKVAIYLPATIHEAQILTLPIPQYLKTQRLRI